MPGAAIVATNDVGSGLAFRACSVRCPALEEAAGTGLSLAAPDGRSIPSENDCAGRDDQECHDDETPL